MYCEGSCGDDWTDGIDDCQQADANAFCMLTVCNVNATASSFEITLTDNDAPITRGFACNRDKIRHGQIISADVEEYETRYEGEWFGIKNVYFTNDMEKTHGSGGSVVSSVVCQTSGKYNYRFRAPDRYLV